MYVWKPQENVIQSEEKAEKCDFFLEAYLMEMNQVKSSIVFQIEFCKVVQNHFCNDIVSQ